MEDSLSYLDNLLRRYKRFPLPEGVGGGELSCAAEEIGKKKDLCVLDMRRISD